MLELWLALGLLLPLPPLPAARAAEQERLVAVGDVHGAYQEFVAILQKTKLIDNRRRWAGGRAVLVQTGDLVDRGSRSRECLDLVMELERQAEKGNGRLIPLLGNHEVMDMLGDLRYVSTDDFHSFATPSSSRVRMEAYDDNRRFRLARDKRLGRRTPPDTDEDRQQWTVQYRSGFFEFRDAFGPRGRYGQWLRRHDVAVKLGDTLFIHAGLSPALQISSIEDLNNRVRAELSGFDSLWQALAEKKIIWRYMTLDQAVAAATEELAATDSSRRPADPATQEQLKRLIAVRQGLLMSAQGPLWYRGLAQLPENELREQITPLLERLQVQRIVAGHSTLAAHRVLPRLGNRVFLIDTGMLAAVYKGSASALEVQPDRLLIYYSDGDTETVNLRL